ncbi:uncharacterized protein V6R79_010790 [Siganus canaliculatus]
MDTEKLINSVRACPVLYNVRLFGYHDQQQKNLAWDRVAEVWRMYRGVIGVSPDNVDACVRATCVPHNFLRRTSSTRTTMPPPGHLVPEAERDAAGLQSVARVGTNNASREAIRVREAFVSYFTNEGAVTWQPADN